LHLARTAQQNPHLFQLTQTVAVKLSEEYPTKEARRCMLTVQTQIQAATPDVERTTSAWDKALSAILSAAQNVHQIACDWFDEMPDTSSRFSQLTSLRILSLRGMSMYATISNDIELPTALENLNIDHLSFRAGVKAENKLAWSNKLRLQITNCEASWSSGEGPGARAKYTEAQIMFNDTCFHTELLKVLGTSHDTLESLEYVDCCIPSIPEHFSTSCHTHFQCFSQLTRLRVSIWNIPNYEESPHLVLPKVTHLELCVSQDDLHRFPFTFRAGLSSIQEGKLLPALKTIKLSTRTTHYKSRLDKDLWRLFRALLHSRWTDESEEDFGGWKKAAQCDLGSNVFLWECGVKFDVTDIVKYVEMFEDESKESQTR
jgi:hypothetical protein